MIPGKRSAKSVCFDLLLNTERTFSVPDDIPIVHLWFTPNEFDEIKQTSRSESREWRKVYSHLLNETFEHPRNDAQDYLTAFCLMQGDLYRRGLERQCNRHHGEQRSDCKDRTRYLVFESQRRLKQSGCKDIDIQLSELYMESSRHAKLFAIRIAKADEIVALGKMESAARTQALVVPKFKRRSSGMSVQSNDSYDSRMLFLQRQRGNSRPNHISNRSTTKRHSSTHSPVTIMENAETYAAIA